MNIHLHASCWNEEAMLPFFFRHYDPFITKYYFYDNFSSDRSREILEAHPRVELVSLEIEGDSFVEAGFKLVNTLWWPSRGEADWVAICNVDEFFWHPDLLNYLKQCKQGGITYFQATGYQMISDAFPSPDEDLTLTIRDGARFKMMDKTAFFDPNEITDSGFAIARHTASPAGNVVRPPEDEILLLHYKHLGLDYVLSRHRELNARRRPGDIEKRFGHHYDDSVTLERHAEYTKNAQELFTLDQARRARPPIRSRF